MIYPQMGLNQSSIFQSDDNISVVWKKNLDVVILLQKVTWLKKKNDKLNQLMTNKCFLKIQNDEYIIYSSKLQYHYSMSIFTLQ